MKEEKTKNILIYKTTREHAIISTMELSLDKFPQGLHLFSL